MAAPIRSCFQVASTFNFLKNPTFLKYVPIYHATKSNFSNFPVGHVAPRHHHQQLSPLSHHSLHQHRQPQRSLLLARYLSTETTQHTEEEPEDDYHSIIGDTERGKGPADTLEFQAETRKLLDIVAKSLYSEKEVFIRELISNASDALEKLRYQELTGEAINDSSSGLEIHIQTNDDKKTFTIQDTGIGLTREELQDNLGTIAKSGSKAFLEQLGDKNEASGGVGSSLIGQFGVGFYSTFMVGDRVDVFTKSYKADSAAYKWSSDGSGKYDISEAEGVSRGTKIVIHLKGDAYDFAKEEVIREIVKKYSNFVGAPIFLNGKRANIVQALWTMDPKQVTDDMHEEFYRYIGNVYDKPRYHMHYKTDAPINIRALFYVPEYKPTMFDMSREADVMGVALYSRKVLIMSKANHVLPKWLRFMKGVVDSEDIPLNLSRELLQDSNLIRKINQVLTGRLLKFFSDQAKKNPVEYRKFYEDYGLFFREGIVTTAEQDQREDIAKLLRFESSKLNQGDLTSLQEYAERMKAGDRNIFFLSAPSRELAERSPYFEALKKRDIEVLFLYEPYDELVLMNLGQFDRKNLKSIENELYDDKEDTDTVDETDGSGLNKAQAEDLKVWIKSVLLNKVNTVKVTKRLDSHPCIITVMEMGSARHFLRTTLADKSQEERLRLLQPTLELNPSHPLVVKMNELKDTDSVLASLLAEQLYDNAMINAGLIDDPRQGVSRIQALLEAALVKQS